LRIGPENGGRSVVPPATSVICDLWTHVAFALIGPRISHDHRFQIAGEKIIEAQPIIGAELQDRFHGIHNAWDAVAYHVFVNTRDKDAESGREEISDRDLS